MIANKQQLIDINIDAVIAGDARLTPSQALYLYHNTSLHDLGRWSTAIADRLIRAKYGDQHPQGDRIRTYLIDRNVNYSNVCKIGRASCRERV